MGFTPLEGGLRFLQNVHCTDGAKIEIVDSVSDLSYGQYNPIKILEFRRFNKTYQPMDMSPCILN